MTSPDPRADLEEADEILKDALDEARSITGNPDSGKKPRAVAQAVLDAQPLTASALAGWPDDGGGEPEPPDPGPGPEPPDPGEYGPEPRDFTEAQGITTTRTIGPGDWPGAVNNAQPGTKLLLRPGNYAGATLSRDGREDAPIILASETDPRDGGTLDVVMTGRLKLTGDWLLVSGVDLKSKGADVDGAHVTLMRWRADNGNVQVNGKYAQIGYCETKNSKGCIGVNFTGKALFGKLIALWGHDYNTTGNDGETFRFGQNPSDDVAGEGDQGMACIAERCLLEDIRYDGNNEAVSVKSSDCELRQVAIVQPSGNNSRSKCQLNIRHGKRNVLDGCYVEGPHTGIGVRNYGNTLLGCKAVGPADICISSGNVDTAYWDRVVAGQADGQGKYVVAEQTTIISPQGKCSVGGSDSIKPIGTVVEDPEPGASYPSGWTIKAEASRTARPAVKWNKTDDTGVMAKWTGWPQP